jgi:hypothetical protein
VDDWKQAPRDKNKDKRMKQQLPAKHLYEGVSQANRQIKRPTASEESKKQKQKNQFCEGASGGAKKS